MNAEYLCDLLKRGIINVSTAGYRIFAVLSHNNVVNRNSFQKLADSDSIVSSIYNQFIVIRFKNKICLTVSKF